MYFGEMMGVTKVLEQKIVDEVVEANELILRSKAIISTWIDTPARPFCRIKEELKKETGDHIRKRMAETDWHYGLNCFFNKQVTDTLKAVQSGME